MHTCLVCIGSNYDKEEKVAFARKRLSELFSSIHFGKEIETEPLNLTNPALFINQLAVFSTCCVKEAVIAHLKAIEKEAGRLPEDKQREKIVLDIDLIKYDHWQLKPLLDELSDSLNINF